jgi:hypothetical protein
MGSFGNSFTLLVECEPTGHDWVIAEVAIHRTSPGKPN